jgi:adenine-specific DNA-methyltransferase
VVETHYCITLDRIPEELYPEIAANDAQREAWVRLFAIDEIVGDMFADQYSDTLTVEFLKANPFLLVDTKFFEKEFKFKAFSRINALDDGLDGILIHSENFQALNLINETFINRVKTVYIDPPFNTVEESFLYKNEYKHSSWITMMLDRIVMLREMLQDDGIFEVAIDDYELPVLANTCEMIFDKQNHLGNLVIEIKPSGRTNDEFLATSHEYLLFFSKNPGEAKITFFDLSEEQKGAYKNEDEEGAYKWRDFLRTGGYSTPQERPNSFYPIYFNEKTSELSLEKKKGWIEIFPVDSSGNNRVWRKTPPSFMRHAEKGEINVTKNREGKWKIQIIDRIKKGTRPKSVWVGSQYDASSHGTKLLQKMFGESRIFSFPKSLHNVKDALHISTNLGGDIILDCFAGSGTTGHAIISLNREDDETRKYILVEMGQYFETVLKPRIQKAVYSEDWKDGKPESRNGVSHAFKYMRLESFEDTLNNLTLRRPELAQVVLLEEAAFGEDYLLHYMLDFESQGSLLDLERFETPFDYQLLIASSTVGETEATPVDLVETFNYLLGLHVQSIRKIEGALVIRGTTRDEKQVLVIWRTVSEMDNDQLNDFFKTNLTDESQEITDIYVNGDNNLANIRPDDQHWNVHLTEESFHRLMFEGIGS